MRDKAISLVVVIIFTVIVGAFVVGVVKGMFDGKDIAAEAICKRQGADTGKWDNTNQVAVCFTTTQTEAR